MTDRPQHVQATARTDDREATARAGHGTHASRHTRLRFSMSVPAKQHARLGRAETGSAFRNDGDGH